MRSNTAKTQKSENLMVRVDGRSKRVITQAATLKGVSASDYVRSVVVARAKQDVEEARTQTIRLSPDEQLLFWRALNAPVSLTRRQRRLGRIMRGEL